MKFHIFPPFGISFKGPRERNEDAIYPAPGAGIAENRFFIVCDGVGGSDKGEVASQLACDMFVKYFEDSHGQEVDAAFLSKALEYAEASFEGYFRAKPQAKGMATTIALVYFHQHGVEVAWCGDTRVYQIRGDKIIFRTEDHSFVNELVRSGTITEDQASKHPNRNVITRAIQGASKKKTALDVRRISDVQAGDYFFICTDGVWEPVNDMMLKDILSGTDENNHKIEAIERECRNNSKDNYSCCLIQVERVEEIPALEPNIKEDNIASHSNAELPGSGQRATLPGRLKAFFKKRKSISNATLAWVLGLIGVIVLIVLIDSRQNRWQESVQGPLQDEFIATEDQAWQRARGVNTIASYDAYLNAYPNGRYVSQARSGRDNLQRAERETDAREREDQDWNRARDVNTIASYNVYLNAYPNGRYASQARSGRDNLQTAEREIAAREREDQMWQQVQNTNTIASYNNYLNAYPSGRYVSQARDEKGKLEQKLREEEARRQSDPFHDQMVLVRGGTFTMGCTSEQGSDCWDNERPAHLVTLGNYYIGKFPVTQSQWRQVMGVNPSRFSRCDDCPVENVSWNEIQGFIRKLNEQTGKRYRLPTEAEWEFAARGGNNSRGYKYSGSNNINEVAWYTGNSSNRTQPVGSKNANELGIHDMSGNVWEWCQDWYGSYTQGSKTNPQGPSSGPGRVLRGGSWFSDARNCRVSNRNSNTPGHRFFSSGFRLALSP